VGIFPEGEDSRGDHGLGRLVEFRFKGPPGSTSSYITTHIIGIMHPCLTGVPTSEVGYTSAMPRRDDHEVHKDMWGHSGGGMVSLMSFEILKIWSIICSTLMALAV